MLESTESMERYRIHTFSGMIAPMKTRNIPEKQILRHPRTPSKPNMPHRALKPVQTNSG